MRWMRRTWVPLAVAGFVTVASAGVAIADPGHDNGPPAVSGFIASVSGSTLTVDTDQGTAVPVAVASNTAVVSAGQTLSSGALMVGERVAVAGQENAGTLDASQIDIQPIRVHGVVGGITGSTFTVQADGASIAITETAGTQVRPAGASVATNDQVSVLGVGAGGTAIALQVDVNNPPNGEDHHPAPPEMEKGHGLAGTVSAIGASGSNQFTIQTPGPNGSATLTLLVSYTTATQMAGGAPQVGDRVLVQGTLQSGVLDATAIRILPPPPAPPVQGTLSAAVTLTVQTSSGTVTVTVPAGALIRAEGSSGGTGVLMANNVQAHVPAPEDSGHD